MKMQPKYFEINFVNDDHKKRIEIPYKKPLLGHKTIFSYECDEHEGSIPVLEEVDGKIWVAQLTSITRPGDKPHIQQILLSQSNVNIEELEILDDSLQTYF